MFYDTIDFNSAPPSAHFQPLLNHTTLFRVNPSSNAMIPQGVLFKKVSNIAQAIACGGVILYDKAHPQCNWWACGKTLVDAIESGVDGMVADFGRIATAKWCRPAGAYKGYANLVEIPTYQGGRGSSNFYLGGHFDPIFEMQPAFVIGVMTDQSRIGALAIVSPATFGYGHGPLYTAPYSHYENWGGLMHFMGGQPVLGYMASMVKLPVRARQFFSDAKPAMLTMTPASLRQFYESTFSDAVDATISGLVDDPDIDLSFGVTTYWRGGIKLEGSTQFKLRVHNTDLPGGSLLLSGYAANSGPHFFEASGTRIENFPGWATQSTYGSGGSPTVKRSDVNRVSVGMTPGFTSCVTPYNSNPRAVLPYMWDERAWVQETDALPTYFGEVSGLKAGEMRDFHTLVHSKVDNDRDALKPAGFANLADLLMQLASESVADNLVPDESHAERVAELQDLLETTEDTPLEQSVQDIYDSQTGEGPPPLAEWTYRSIWTPGTLIDTVRAFSVNWDRLARRAAKAS